MALKRHISCIVLLLCLLVCLSKVILAGNTRTGHNVHMLLDQSINGNLAISMEKVDKDSEEVLNYALWGQINGQTLENPDLNRDHTADIIYVKGSVGLFINYSGSFDTSDPNGCLLDKESAWQLFGDSHAIGRKITYDGKEYTIQGILEDMESVLVIPVTAKTTEVIDRVCLEVPEGTYGEDMVEKFKSIHNAQASSVEYQFYQYLSSLWLFIIPLMMGIYIFAALLKQALKSRKYPAILWGYTGIALAFVAVFLWIMQVKFSLPQEFIPNQWSDFDFFVNLYEEKLKSIQLLLGTENPKPLMPYINAFWQSLIYGVLALILWTILHIVLKIKNSKTLYVYIICALTGAFICVLLFNDKPEAAILAGNRSLWFALPVYFLGRYMVYRCRNFSKTL